MGVKAGQRYRHWKGGLVVVDSVSSCEASMEQTVTYWEEHEPSRLWSRPLHVFLGKVDHGDQARFVFESEGAFPARFRRLPQDVQAQVLEKFGSMLRYRGGSFAGVVMDRAAIEICAVLAVNGLEMEQLT